MSAAESISLLGYVQTPILVGDPEGRIVYANPAFCSIFCADAEDPIGRPLAMVFGGGAREAMLSATASVLEGGRSARLQLREAGHGYTGLASPIDAEDDRVGVIMVLLEEPSNEDQLGGLVEEVAAPLGEALESLRVASSELRGVLTERQHDLLEGSRGSLEEAHEWLRELQRAMRGGKRAQGRFDVAGVILRVADRLRQELGEDLDLEVLMPPDLPRIVGTPAVLERLLSQLVRMRLGESRTGEPMTLLARRLDAEGAGSVLVSLVDRPDASRRQGTGHPPEMLQQGLLALGGESICVEDSLIGRVTSMRLTVAAA